MNPAALEDVSGLPRAPRIARRRRRPFPWLRTGLTAAAAIAVLAHLAPEPPPEPEPITKPEPVPKAVLSAPPPRWEPIEGATSLYAVRAADGSLLPAIHEARRHRSGAREDSLIYGSPGDEGHARLSVLRGPEDDPTSFFIDLTRLAADAGLAVTRSHRGRAVTTKLGAFEVATVTVSGAAEQACVAFRFEEPALTLRVRGWLCGSAEQPAGDDHLACFIDRLTLLPGGDDPALRVLFAQAERLRNPGCMPAATPLARHEDAPIPAARKGS
jgi:hypothetical protein